MESKAVQLVGILILVATHIVYVTGDVKHLPAAHTDAPNSEYDDRDFDEKDIRMIGCQSSPCGPHAECTEIDNGGTGVNDYTCKCLADYINRPPNCRPECTTDSHCSDDMNCMNHHCKDACSAGHCGLNAVCKTKDHHPKCECKENFLGDPYHQCVQQRNQTDPCNSIKCGNNTKCVRQNGVGFCQCLPNHVGNPYIACTISASKALEPKCLKHTDCSSKQACIQNKCINPCPDFCPENAECKMNDHTLNCLCKPGYTGDNYHHCTKIEEKEESKAQQVADSSRDPKNFTFECTIDDECLANRSCVANECRDPCISFSCGRNTKCNVIEHRPTCSCLLGYFGADPKRGCQPVPVSKSTLNASIEFIGGVIGETTLLPIFDSDSNYTEYKMTIEPSDAVENVIYVKKDHKKLAVPQAAFSGLKPGRGYNISIQAKLGNQLSIPFSRLYRTTPLAPLNLALDAGSLTAHGFRVIWQTPPANATDFDEYDLVIGNKPTKPDDDDGDDTEIRAQPPPAYEFFEEHRVQRSKNETNEYAINGLRPGETYEVSVKTISAEYTGSHAINVDVTTRPLPVKSLQFSIDVDTEHVTLQWHPNTLSKQDEYKIDYYYDDERVRNTLKTNQTSHVFQTLLPNKDYSFFVWAISKTIESNETAIYLPKRHP